MPVVGTPERAAVKWWHEDLPANCSATWVCPGGSGSGYPEYSCSRGAEVGYKTLAVYYYGCTFNCLFCRNWECHQAASTSQVASARDVARAIDRGTRCIGFFGGDPTPQLPHALSTARRACAEAKSKGQLLRVCWETNGSMSQPLLRKMVDVALQTGGCVKFDLKARSDALHRGLCGVSNATCLENFAYVARRAAERPQVPLLVAATTLVPGYIDEEEIKGLARFIASLDSRIPYLLLGFIPAHELRDLPPTSVAHARACARAARACGLKNVRLGNRPALVSGTRRP